MRVLLPALLLCLTAAACGSGGSGAAHPVDAGGAGAVDASADAPAGPRRLSQSHLYADFATRTIASDIQEFAPAHVLWSDGAHKRRWIRLPPGTQIDTSDMDHWVFPIGTQFFKEFALEGVLLETRMIERTGPGREDYWMGSFVWAEDQSEAVFQVDGQMNINGTQHDAPAAKVCWSCHVGDRGRSLGFSAIQLSHRSSGDADVTLRGLADSGLLSDPPPAGVDYPVPGDPATAAALGYLHANCGHCHNLAGASWPDTQMVLRLTVAERTPETTGVYASTLRQSLQHWRHDGYSYRIAPGDPTQSAIVYRMSARGNRDGMPPLATEITDPAGIDLVTTWIASLR